MILASKLVWKANYNSKFEVIKKKIPNHDKYIATKEIHELTKKNFAEKLKQAKLMTSKILLMLNKLLLKIIKIGKLQTWLKVFLLVKVTLTIMDHKICYYLNQFSHENLKDCQMNKHNSKMKVKIKKSYLKQDKLTFITRNSVNLFIIYELDIWSGDLKDSLFGAVKVTKNAVLDKFSCPGYGIGFGSRSLFSLSNFDRSKNY